MDFREDIEPAEKEFFRVFEIQPKLVCNCQFKNLHDFRLCIGSDVCDYIDSTEKNPCLKCNRAKEIYPLYPEISNETILRLLCILIHEVSPITFVKGEAQLPIRNIRNMILQACVKCRDKIKEKVEVLFME